MAVGQKHTTNFPGNFTIVSQRIISHAKLLFLPLNCDFGYIAPLGGVARGE